ncbi:MAG: hypothetical protein IIC33_07655 [Chloroflexi bacterium]|nr:hypothetical protein [Chloroflexota bacterium]
MEWVSIQEASRRLNVSQDSIRRYAREGRLQVKKQAVEPGRAAWIVELPDEGWEDDFKGHVREIAEQLIPWWWSTKERQGQVHYVDGLGIEEIEALFLCGLKTNDIWSAVGHDKSQRCPKCLEEVTRRGFPMETRE